MRKSRNIIRKRRISKRRSIYGGQVPGEVKACPNELEPTKKWKYGNNCYTSCDETDEKTFPVSWDDDHDQRTCEADTPSNRRRYNLLRLGPSTVYKGFRVARDTASRAAEAVGNKAFSALFGSYDDDENAQYLADVYADNDDANTDDVGDSDKDRPSYTAHVPRDNHNLSPDGMPWSCKNAPCNSPWRLYSTSARSKMYPEQGPITIWRCALGAHFCSSNNEHGDWQNGQGSWRIVNRLFDFS
jgi:hypothetical protein